MLINSLNNIICGKKNINFTGAVLNINSFSDTHGGLENLDTFYRNIDENRDEITLKQEKGNRNVLLIVGDWFMSGATKGYKSKKDANSHYFQIKFFNEFVNLMKQGAKDLTTYFVPGNHETDAGCGEFKRVLKGINAKVLMTNLDFTNSPALKDETDSNKIIRQDILEIEDDKDPNKTHKVLFLGINPINMPYYQKDLEGINFIDKPFKCQAKIKEEDYEDTFNKTVELIENFKKENPKGIVVAALHTGCNFAENLAKKAGGNKINIIFNAHEHKDEIKDINGVKIVDLCQNFEKFTNVKFHINDDGSLEDDIKITEYHPFECKDSRDKANKGYFAKLFEQEFKKDIAKEYKIATDIPDLTKLDIKGARTQNNYLANFITDSILEEIQKTNPEVDTFAINATAIRRSLSTESGDGVNNLTLLEVLSGIVEKDAGIFKNKVSGATFLDVIMDNLLFNEKMPERNALMQYSGIIIDKKSLLEGYHAGKSANELAQYVTFAKDGNPLDLEKTYIISNVENIL